MPHLISMLLFFKLFWGHTPDYVLSISNMKRLHALLLYAPTPLRQPQNKLFGFLLESVEAITAWSGQGKQ